MIPNLQEIETVLDFDQAWLERRIHTLRRLPNLENHRHDIYGAIGRTILD